MKAWKNEKCCGNTNHQEVFLQFLHSCFSDSVEKRYNASFILYFLDASHLRVPMGRQIERSRSSDVSKIHVDKQ